jgi:CHAD domain-containing protein
LWDWISIVRSEAIAMSTRAKPATGLIQGAAQLAQTQPALPSLELQTLGEFACTVLHQQYRSILKHEKAVLDDRDPEDLHKMRVSTRRLQTGLLIFSQVVILPKPARYPTVQQVAKALGGLRDLDVQLAELQTGYCPQLPRKEQSLVQGVIRKLQKHRKKALKQLQRAISATQPKSFYPAFKTAFTAWFAQPDYQPVATLPLSDALPDLLTPLCADLLLHPGWWIPAQVACDSQSCQGTILHELRKQCKKVRYQAEFFAPFYGASFQEWLEEIKTLQEHLGQFQDSQVLAHLLDQHLPSHACLPTLESLLADKRQGALTQWDALRQRYLNGPFRTQLYTMVLNR